MSKPLVRQVRAGGLLGVEERERRKVVPGADELLGAAESERSKKHAIHDREDCCCRADADGQREDDSDAEQRGTPQRTPGVGQAVETVHVGLDGALPPATTAWQRPWFPRTKGATSLSAMVGGGGWRLAGSRRR